MLCLVLGGCGQPGVEIVRKGTVAQNPTATVGEAIGSYAGFKEVTWEQYLDQHGVTRVLATGEFRMDLPEIALCPKSGAGGEVRAARAFLRMMFVVDLKTQTFAYTGSEYLMYSPKGWSRAIPAGPSGFEAILQGMSGLDCGLLYVQGP